MLFIFTYVLLLVIFNLNTSIDFTYITLLFIPFTYFASLILNTTNNVTIFNFKFTVVSILLQLQLLSLSLLKSTYLLVMHFNFTLKWKPLFKKSSYFGLYRSTRNQFLNK